MDITTRLREWVEKALPALNNATEAGSLRPSDLLEAVQFWTQRVVKTFQDSTDNLTRTSARTLLQLLGFCMSSLERQYQAAGAEKGHALQRLGRPLEALVQQLGTVGEHIPRDSVYTYWLWNRSEPVLTFTGDSQERFFNTAVVQTDDLNVSTCALLRPICTGQVPVFAPEAVRLIRHATANMVELRRLYASFMQVDPAQNRRPIEPEFFAFRMRSYLPTYPIAGVMWSGVNAGNLCSQIQADYLIGTVTNDYSEVVAKRWPYLIPEDRLALEKDMATLSLFDQLLKGIGSSRKELVQRPDLLEERVAATQKAQSALGAYETLVNATGDQSATHYALIMNYLTKVAAKLDSSARKRLPVKPDAGTGGMPHSETRQIMEMRRNHPLIASLLNITNSAYAAHA